MKNVEIWARRFRDDTLLSVGFGMELWRSGLASMLMGVFRRSNTEEQYGVSTHS